LAAQFNKFKIYYCRHKVAHNEITITLVSFISLLLYLNVDATSLQAVYIITRVKYEWNSVYSIEFKSVGRRTTTYDMRV